MHTHVHLPPPHPYRHPTPPHPICELTLPVIILLSYLHINVGLPCLIISFTSGWKLQISSLGDPIPPPPHSRWRWRWCRGRWWWWWWWGWCGPPSVISCYLPNMHVMFTVADKSAPPPPRPHCRDSHGVGGQINVTHRIKVGSGDKYHRIRVAAPQPIPTNTSRSLISHLELSKQDLSQRTCDQNMPTRDWPMLNLDAISFTAVSQACGSIWRGMHSAPLEAHGCAGSACQNGGFITCHLFHPSHACVYGHWESYNRLRRISRKADNTARVPLCRKTTTAAESKDNSEIKSICIRLQI